MPYVNPGYSPVEHLARICWCSPRWREVQLAMFVACFDASGQEATEPWITVAGFVAPAGAWQEFEEKWKARLKRDGLAYFRMSECAHSTGEFAHGWKGNERRRRPLLSDLMDIIKSNVSRKFSVSIESGSLAAHVDENLRRHYLLNAYVLAARACAGTVIEWARRERITTPIEFVFEEGDEGQGKLVERFKYDNFGVPIFRYKKDTLLEDGLHPAFTPLHAADFLAYEMFQVASKRSDSRWPWGEFKRIVGEPGYMSQGNLDNWNMKLQVALDHARWWREVVNSDHANAKGKAAQ